MEDKAAAITGDSVRSEEDFEKLILAYDYSLKKESPFRTVHRQRSLCVSGSCIQRKDKSGGAREARRGGDEGKLPYRKGTDKRR